LKSANSLTPIGRHGPGHLIEAERPEALVNAVLDYVERRESFIVGRRSGIINP